MSLSAPCQSCRTMTDARALDLVDSNKGIILDAAIRRRPLLKNESRRGPFGDARTTLGQCFWRRGQDSNLQALSGGGFQDRCTTNYATPPNTIESDDNLRVRAAQLRAFSL